VQALDAAPLAHEVLRCAEREACLLEALKRTDSGGLAVSGPHRAGDWERGWTENLREFEQSGGAADRLVPKYNRHSVLRLQGDYVRVADVGFEYGFYTALREFLFRRWFARCASVTEFGCGTGTSLLLLAQVLPSRPLLGCDWAEASQLILQRLAARTGQPIRGRRFDMFHPDPALALGPDAGVLTSAAMEQIGADHGAFCDWLLAQEPAVAVHIEPLVELYDPRRLFDEVAIRYHRRRNYLSGFVPWLKARERERRLEILELRRTGFGSFFHEGYSVAVWRSTRAGGAGR
jgi:hypothetical protein